MAEILKLEEELKALQKQRGEVEHRLKDLHSKERIGQKRTRDSRVAPNNNAKDDARGTEESKDSNNRTKDEPFAKRSRLSSAIVGKSSSDTRDRDRETRDKDRDRDRERNGRESRVSSREESNSHSGSAKPKLTSAIANPSMLGDRPRPNAEGGNVEDTKRHRKIFGVLVGTLQQFKADLTKKSDVTQRREEIEQKITQRAKKEDEQSLEEQRRTLQEIKQKEAALKETLDKQLEEKELELLNLKWQHHRNLLSSFFKTDAKPQIYYRPNPAKSEEKKGKAKEQDKNQENEKEKETSKGVEENSPEEKKMEEDK